MQKLSDEKAEYLAGKTDPNDSSLWLPLWMHLRDTAEIMDRLVRRWLPDSTKHSFGMSEEKLASLARFLGYSHDIGKATVLFQTNIMQAMPDARLRLERYTQLTYMNANKHNTPHALASEAILLELGVPAGAASVAGAHHGKPQSEAPEDNMEAYRSNYYPKDDKRFWKQCWTKLLQQAMESSRYRSTEDIPELTQPIEILLTGLLVMADWIASNTDYFPLIPIEEYGDPLDYPARAEAAWERLQLTFPWEAQPEVANEYGFRLRFGFSPNTIQKAVTNAVLAMNVPGIMILEAPMGIGKTEAGLAFAELCAARFGAGGIFFGLPTQATANGIFPRLMQWAESQSDDMVHSVRLAHGMAELNEEYRGLQERMPQVEEDAYAETESVTVHQWFCGNKKALLADFVIGTVDQLLMAALKQRHVMLRHLGLAGKVVIVDEVHAYDAYMNQYLDRALSWLGWYRVPVILLSATLPSKRRAELIRAYQPEAEDGVWTRSAAYPLVTWTDGREVHQNVPDIDTEARKVNILKSTEAEITDILREKMQAGGCAGIIVNTVRKAQLIAERLEQEMPEKEVMLFHSQFLMTDRAEKENLLMKRIGKHSAAIDRNNLIVVGTQVMEQSLDVDFDFLITELCPMDLLLQRIGRLHRHRRERPAPMKQAVCCVLDTGNEELDKGSKAVYGEWLLHRTRELLPENILLPQDISLLVQRTYDWDSDISLRSSEEKNMCAAYEKQREKQKQKANAYVIQQPEIHKDFPWLNTLDGWMQDDMAGNDAASRAAVRDGEMSIEVLVMVRHKDGHIGFLPWQEKGEMLAADRQPDLETARRIARQKLRLPGIFSKVWNADRVIRELEEMNMKYLPQWQLSPMLKGELILLLDDTLSAHVGSMLLQYDRKTGLSSRKEDEDEGN